VDCYVCYCAVFKCVGVVTILTMYTPLTVGSSPCLCPYVVNRSVYADIMILLSRLNIISYTTWNPVAPLNMLESVANKRTARNLSLEFLLVLMAKNGVVLLPRFTLLSIRTSAEA
jgi:hypothetical protein